MALSFLYMHFLEMFVHRRQLILYAAAWTAVVAATVASVSLFPEIVFSWAVSPSSSFSWGACEAGAARLPLDGPPGEVVCVPAQLLGRSPLDYFVPPLFAAAAVAGSACFVRAIGLWETEDEPDSS